MRQRRHGDGAVVLIGARNQVGQVVGHHEGHLAVRQDAGLGPARGARGVEEPQRVVVGDHLVGTGRGQSRRGDGCARGVRMRCRVGQSSGVVAQRCQVRGHQIFVGELSLARPADGNDVSQRGRGGAGRVHVRGERILRDHGHRPAGRGQIGHLRRRQAKVRRHPHAAQAEGHPAALEHRAVIARVHEEAVALLQAEGAQRGGHGRYALLDLAPGPPRLALDQAGAVREELRRVREQTSEVAGLGGVHSGRRSAVAGRQAWHAAKLAALPLPSSRFQHAQVVGHGRAAHVEDGAQAGAFHLHVSRSAGQLHGGHHMLRHPRGAYGVALGLEAS